MTDPIEAVARALHARPRHYSMPWDELVALADNSRDPEQSAFVRLVNRQRAEARAAIAAFLDAVREPSDGMIQRSWFYDGSIDVWPAMIDALRAELLPPPVEKIGDV